LGVREAQDCAELAADFDPQAAVLGDKADGLDQAAHWD
jgi:hypothetical protein